MIPVLNFSPIIRQLEKVRISAGSSVIPPILPSPVGTNDVISVKIQPEAAGPEFEVWAANKTQDEWYLDTAYAATGDKVITLTIEDLAGNIDTTTSTITVADAADDIFFSSDEKLQELEPDVRKYLPSENNNFNYAHRSITSLIINWLMLTGYKKSNSVYYTASDLLNVFEVSELARYWALELIYWSISNKSDDHFREKSVHYKSLREKQQSVVGITLNASTTSGETAQATFGNSITVMKRGRG